MLLSIPERAVYIDTQEIETNIPAKVLILPVPGEYEITSTLPHAGKWRLEIQPTPADEVIDMVLDITK